MVERGVDALKLRSKTVHLVFTAGSDLEPPGLTCEQRSAEEPSSFHPYYLDLAYGMKAIAYRAGASALATFFFEGETAILLFDLYALKPFLIFSVAFANL